jgi:hypothetical protein
MMNAFYKAKPTVDTPYRQLVLEYDEKGSWQVRLIGGTKWGRENAQDLKVTPAKSFDDGMDSYNKMFRQLQEEGWKPYNPFIPW